MENLDLIYQIAMNKLKYKFNSLSKESILTLLHLMQVIAITGTTQMPLKMRIPAVRTILDNKLHPKQKEVK